ncbi:40S ribosomal protein S5-1 [Hordeum vulgare]|nr:40S ribosomal protein S5-1 [Hordeum vulgare]
MADSRSSKDKFFDNIYLREVMQYPQAIQMRDGVLHIRDVQGPKGTGSVEARLEAMEQEVFRCKGMVEHGLNANHLMIADYTRDLKVDGKSMKDVIFSLNKQINFLHSQINDLQSQVFEYKARFKEYALDDLDFFHMNISMAEAASSLLALITIRGGKTSSPAIITNELRLLFCLDWDYEVTPVLDHEFMAVFSDPISLRYATRSEEITLTLNSFTINIKVPTRDPTSLATLSTVWIRIRGLPQIARNNGVIRSMFKMFGMIIEVDLISLVREKIVCAKVKHRAPSKLQATIWMFFNDNRI